MTNEEKYKTPDERLDAFKKFCESKECHECVCSRHGQKGVLLCEFLWLALEDEEKKPLPCPFCGSVDIVVASSVIRPGYVVSCCNCGATSRAEVAKAEAIAAWNRRAK